MEKQDEYLVKYRFINTGSEEHSVFRTDPGETRPVQVVIEDAWRGLLCKSGGLRNIISIKKIEQENTNENTTESL